MAKFEKGHKKIPGSGMQPGQTTAKVQAWNKIDEYVTGPGADRYLSLLIDLPDKEFMNRYENLVEYFKPKLQRAEVKQETTVNDLRTFPKHVYIGYTDAEELRLRREDDKIPIESNELPGKVNVNYRDAEDT